MNIHQLCPTAAHSNADTLSRLPLVVVPSDVPAVPEPVLLPEQIDDGPFAAQQVRHYTSRDPCLSKVLNFILHGWPNFVKDDTLKPYWNRRTEYSMGK